MQYTKIIKDVLKVINKYTDCYAHNEHTTSFEITTPDLHFFVNISDDFTYIIEAKNKTKTAKRVDYLFTLTDLSNYLKENVK